MLVGLGASDYNLCGYKTLEAGDEVGLILGPLVSIGRKNHIGFKEWAIGCNESRQMWRAYFLLPFKEELHIYG